MRGTRQASIALIASITTCGLLAGCNRGAATTCGQYQKDSTAQRVAAVTKMLSKQGRSTSGLAIDGTRVLVATYCFTHPASDPIGNALGS
jgi:hypothetical protein